MGGRSNGKTSSAPRRATYCGQRGPVPMPALCSMAWTLMCRAAFTADLEWFSLPGGAVLFERNEPSDGFYIVLAGGLGVIAAESVGLEGPLPRIEAGETVGEIGMLTGRPRSATVVALSA